MAPTLLQVLGGEGSLPLLLTVAGFILVIMEAFAPGAHFIVLGVALLLAGLLGLALGSLASPLVLAGLVFAIGAVSLFVYREFDFYGGKGAGQTSDSDDLAGKTGRVTERVTETGGEVKLKNAGFNPYYRARSLDGDIDEGEEVIVVDPGGGNVVTVQSVETDQRDNIDRELARERAGESDSPDDASTSGDAGDGAIGDDAPADDDTDLDGSDTDSIETDAERESTG
ncbi:NfeD family protein [Halostella sp. PRR32]|uniref:NfeD family protein n=1 Tax=Halostella sp. PRR32 TaxID=3098147 RepID=UPI002B1DCD09|nr:NfeD family protein [Halostella sp. PRR32]